MIISKTLRQVKLHSKLRTSERGWTKATSTGRVVPWLNISGQWLDQAGFHAGNRVQIEVTRNQLIIKKVPEHGTHRA